MTSFRLVRFPWRLSELSEQFEDGEPGSGRLSK